MEPVNLIALKSLKYAGTRLRPGDRFTATRAHAKAFVKALKKAKYADAPPATTDPALSVEEVRLGETDIPSVHASDIAATEQSQPETYETKVEQPVTEQTTRLRRHRGKESPGKS